MVEYTMAQTTDTLSLTFAALADPTRRAILARLAKGEASVTELAEPFDMSLAAVSKHLQVLERAKLVERGREAPWRPARRNATPLRAADGWAERDREFWAAGCDRPDEVLHEIKKKEKSRDRTR